MLIVPEVNEYSGHEYSFHSSWNKSKMRFHDVAMATGNLMNQLEEVGIISKEEFKVRVSNNALKVYMYMIVFPVNFNLCICTHVYTYQWIKYMHVHCQLILLLKAII
jgi:hypothetical protein